MFHSRAYIRSVDSIRKRYKTNPPSHTHYRISFLTPVIEPRRFDTDFYVVHSSYENEKEGLESDESETVGLRWIEPEKAIELNKKGEIRFLPPQFFVLDTIAKVGKTPEEVIDWVVKERKHELDRPLLILPHAVAMQEKSLTLAYPGDEEHCDYPGKQGARHRINVALPMGATGGFLFESNLGKFAMTQRDWNQSEKGGGGNATKGKL